MAGGRQWDMSEIIAWLESTEGERWSRATHNLPGGRTVYMLMSIKNDQTDGIDKYLWLA